MLRKDHTTCANDSRRTYNTLIDSQLLETRSTNVSSRYRVRLSTHGQTLEFRFLFLSRATSNVLLFSCSHSRSNKGEKGKESVCIHLPSPYEVKPS